MANDGVPVLVGVKCFITRFDSEEDFEAGRGVVGEPFGLEGEELQRLMQQPIDVYPGIELTDE